MIWRYRTRSVECYQELGLIFTLAFVISSFIIHTGCTDSRIGSNIIETVAFDEELGVQLTVAFDEELGVQLSMIAAASMGEWYGR